MPVATWIVRWIGFVALAGLIGGFVVDLLVLPPAGPTHAGLRRRLRGARLIATVALVFAGGGELWLRAATMRALRTRKAVAVSSTQPSHGR